ncbi:MFS transporter [uncultured Catenibacterium sp.]|uniref:MFS transporter n=1 Tax=uncultured Catenibacterium sp. TaxID=286142 RepID=UPI0025E0957F|nr:MFS transporter [uncultured Catenibacterium sp.]
MKGLIETMNKLTKLEKYWILYDVGNSAFILLVSTIIPIYFNYLASLAKISEVDYLAYWGYASSFTTLIVAIIGPVLGSIVDTKGYKKPIFTISMIIGVLGLAFLSVPTSWTIFLGVFVIAKIGYNASLIFYDSMLLDITDDKRMDYVSSQGYAWGYIGSCVPFVVSLVFVLFYEKMGIPFKGAMTIAFLINALWWLGMTVPLLKNYKQVHFVEKQEHPIRDSFKRLGHTLSTLNEDKKVFFYLISFFFYIDGVYTIIEMATAYGSALGLNTNGLLIALFAIQLDKQWEFWILAIFVGMFQGAIQALSRSYFAKIIPPKKSGEYFGLFDICGKGASFMGTTLVGLISQLTGHMNYGVAMISVMFVIGFYFFQKAAKL